LTLIKSWYFIVKISFKVLIQQSFGSAIFSQVLVGQIVENKSMFALDNLVLSVPYVLARFVARLELFMSILSI